MDERIIRDPAAYTGYAVISAPAPPPKIDTDSEWDAYVARCKAKRDAAIARAEQESAAGRGACSQLAGSLMAELEQGRTVARVTVPPELHMKSVRTILQHALKQMWPGRRFVTRIAATARTVVVTRMD